MEAQTKNLWCIERRSNPRYLVRSIPTFELTYEYWPDLLAYGCGQVDNVSLSGCGVVRSMRGLSQSTKVFGDNTLLPEHRVTLSIEMRGLTDRPIAMDGICVHISKTFDEETDRILWYYGIEFNEECQLYISPLIQRLEALEKRGLVDIAY